MQNKNSNFNGMTALIADESENFATVLSRMLREFGITDLIKVVDGVKAMEVVSQRQVDMAFLDCYLPEVDGFELTKNVRTEPGPNQMIPVLITTSHTQQENVVKMRDCGASIVLAKPVSPAIVYDRLAWVASETRDFISGETYVGPDRRFKIEGYPGESGRRAEDHMDVGEQTEPDMSQDEIDSLFD